MAGPGVIVDEGDGETVRPVEPGQGAEDVVSMVRGFVEFRCRCVSGRERGGFEWLLVARVVDPDAGGQSAAAGVAMWPSGGSLER